MIGFRSSMAMGLPGNLDDPYRAGITTVTSGFGFEPDCSNAIMASQDVQNALRQGRSEQ
jgi:hypothetical protein